MIAAWFDGLTALRLLALAGGAVVAGFGARFTPTMRLLITSGITVMRIALTKSVPTGSSQRAAVER